MKQQLRSVLVVFWLVLSACLTLPGQGLSVSAKSARAVPPWINKLTIYQVWMWGFSADAKLNSLTARLPHIADLGASVVYISPIQQRGSSPNGTPYATRDYYAIDPEYGTEADLQRLTQAAHKLNLKVMLDVVFYHTSNDTVMLQMPSFMRRDKEGRLELGRWKQALPNFDNPKAREYLINSLVHWVRDAGVDGFRCDVAAGVPLDFWEQARDALDKVNRDVIMLAEAEMPEQQLKAFDMSYNFTYYPLLRAALRDGEPASDIRKHWEKQRTMFPRGARMLHYSSNHDLTRAVLEFGQRGAFAASVLNFTLDGIPFHFNGEEIADTEIKGPMAKVPIRWDVIAGGRRGPSLMPQVTSLNAYKKLFQLRRQEGALTDGELVWVNNSEPDSVLTFLRKKGDEEIFVAVNLSNRKRDVVADLSAPDRLLFDDLFKGNRGSFR